MQDQITIAITENAALRVYAATTTELVRTAQAFHRTHPVATAALGRVLTAGAMMAAMEKRPGTDLTIQFKGGGALGTVLVTAEADSAVRGYVDVPDVELPLRAKGKLDVGKAVGTDGFLSIVKDFGSGEPYTGRVALVTGEIAEDLTYYYAASEQTPTAIALGVLVGTDGIPIAAGGYILQMMPGRGTDDDAVIAAVERKLKELPPVSTLVAEGSTSEDLIRLLLDNIPYNALSNITPQYRCNCSRKRVEKALISIGASDLQSMIDEGIGAEVNCHFCDKVYAFTTEELVKLTL
jgi:molecular chaperone Hsp33